jgi:hypothetical protein
VRRESDSAGLGADEVVRYPRTFTAGDHSLPLLSSLPEAATGGHLDPMKNLCPGLNRNRSEIGEHAAPVYGSKARLGVAVTDVAPRT